MKKNTKSIVFFCFFCEGNRLLEDVKIFEPMIVLIEDNAVNVSCFKKLLEGDPSEELVRFVTASNVLEFVKAHHKEITLVVLDGNLPPIMFDLACNGPDLAKEIIAFDSTLPIASWTDDVGMLERFRKVFHSASNHYFLAKPCTKKLFADLIVFYQAVSETQNKYFNMPRS